MTAENFREVLIPLVRAWSNRTKETEPLEPSATRLNPFSQGVVQQDAKFIQKVIKLKAS